MQTVQRMSLRYLVRPAARLQLVGVIPLSPVAA